MKFPFLIWVTRLAELFKTLFLIFIEFESAGVIHSLDLVRSFVLLLDFLAHCLPINLSTVLPKDLNDKSGFSSDSVSTTFQLTLFRSSSKAIELKFLNYLFTRVLSISCFENGF